ncbi:uncharacterized protein SRS1_15428 [Sporisorium reilianum f. sp. reilianum]|uniref:Uncharacterized protein n=1 Tax=Sporisorium reilianum f. sp. reilianum TaxID=72559 RepID=A0A2N8UID8_9BASI|nr:uncharacterized protein SRS1_15428 [Sporisorium reilianum f. sp. reilianum]
MDPAFSLADELAELHHHGEEEELQFHAHTFGGSGTTLEDEFAHEAGLALDAELEGLRLGGVEQLDLESELMGGDVGSRLGAELELDPEFAADEAEVVMARNGAYSAGMGDGSPAHSGSRGSPSRTATPASSIVPPTDLADTLECTQAFLSRLSRLSSTTTLSPEGEDTANLELAAARYLTLVAHSTTEREAQLRQLRDLHRRLDRSLPPTSPTHTRTASLSSDTTITTPSPLVDTTRFAPLYTSTSALLTSLTALHEHTQVAKSTAADAARKLKTVKGLIGQWRAEGESVLRSEAWIAAHGAEEGTGGKRGGEWVREQVEWCATRWDEAERRAAVLLTPVSLAL